MQLGQRYGRQTIGHNSNINNRHTALYIYSATGQRNGRLLVRIAIVAIDFQNYSCTELHDSLFLLYSYSELYTETRYRGV